MLAVETATLVSLWSLCRIPSISHFKICMFTNSQLAAHILSESHTHCISLNFISLFICFFHS